MANTALANTSPVVQIAGRADAELSRDVLRLEIDHSVSQISSLRLHLNPLLPRRDQTDGFSYLHGGPIDFGVGISVSLGAEGLQRKLFEGKVSAVQVAYEDGDTPHVSVYAEDALLGLRVTTRSRTYRQSSDADAIRKIAADHGLTAHVDASGPTHDVIQQLDLDDLSFVQSRAARIGAEVWCDGRTLHVATRDQRRAPNLTLRQGFDLLALRARADLATQRSGASVSGFDARRRERIDGNGPPNAVQAEATSGRFGPTLFANSYGSHPERFTTRVPLTSGQADAWARAESLRRARRFVTVHGTTKGSPTLVVGANITLERVGGPFDGGGYVVTRALHTFDLAHGHRTTFTAERPNIGAD